MFNVINQINYISELSEYQTGIVSMANEAYTNKIDTMHWYNDMLMCEEYKTLMTDFKNIKLDIVQESVGNKVKEFFNKVIEIIKKFFSFIGKSIKGIIDKIFKRNIVATPDQICEEVLKNKSSVIKESVEQTNDSIKVHFPAMSGSVIEECDLEVITKDLEIKLINNGGQTGKLDGIIGKGYTKIESDKLLTIHMKNTGNENAQINLFLAYINNKHEFADKCNALVDFLLKYQDGKIGKLELDILTGFLDNFRVAKQKAVDEGWNFKLSLKILTDRQRAVNEVSNKILKLNQFPECDDNSRYSMIIREIMDTFNGITIGCNQFGIRVNGMDMIDKKYYHSIDNLELLDKFVSTMIKSGIPSRMVAYNTWLVMDDKFDDRGFFAMKDLPNKKYSTVSWGKITQHEKSRGRKVLPRWGQTRAVFFPLTSSSVVIKIALNTMGIVANKREFQIFNIYKKYGKDDLLSAPDHNYGQYSVVTMEKVLPFEKRSDADYRVNEVIKDIKRVHDEIPSLPLISDIHSDNIGLGVNNEGKELVKIIDYAG